MDTAFTQKFPFILDRNLAKANCTGNQVCTSCDTVVHTVSNFVTEFFSFKKYCFVGTMAFDAPKRKQDYPPTLFCGKYEKFLAPHGVLLPPKQALKNKKLGEGADAALKKAFKITLSKLKKMRNSCAECGRTPGMRNIKFQSIQVRSIRLRPRTTVSQDVQT